jgi:hypothetical protein
LDTLIPCDPILDVRPNIRGYFLILLHKVGFYHILVDFIGFLVCTWRFLALFGGYWALFEARYWGEVGRWLPTSDLHKPGLLEAMRGDSEQVYVEDLSIQIHFYAGKLLKSAPLQAIYGSSSHSI